MAELGNDQPPSSMARSAMATGQPAASGRSVLRRLAWWLLTLLLIGSFALTAVSAFQLFSAPRSAWLVERAADSIEAAIDKEMAKHVSQKMAEDRLGQLLNEEPRNWMVIDTVVSVVQERGWVLSPEIDARMTSLRKDDESLRKKALRCLGCLRDATNCDYASVLWCRLPIELTPIGDLLTLVRETKKWLASQPIDSFDVTLSAVGLAAVAMAPPTHGSSLAVKVGVAVTKTARRMGRLSNQMVDTVKGVALRAVDKEKLAAARSVDDVAGAIRTAEIRPLQDTLADLGRVQAAVGNPGALHLMRFVDTPEDARHLARISEALKAKTIGRLELLGKSRLIRATMRYADEVYALIAGMVSTFVALIGLAWSVLSNALVSLLRWITGRSRTVKTAPSSAPRP